MTPIQNPFIRGMHNLRPQHRGSVVTIGSFDGVHLGHQAIIRQLREKSAELGLPSVVVLFEPQPHEYFSGEKAPARLMRLREKALSLYACGVDRVCCLQFNQALRSLSAVEFIQRVLIDGLGVRYLVVGDDFRFGCDRSGDYTLLQKMGAEQNFEVTDTRTLEVLGERVSSTRIRDALAAANFSLVEKLLGKPYSISGHVAYGQQLGRQLGAPTANVQLRRYRVPLQGVFAVRATLADGAVLQGVANVGVRPTVGDELKPILEVHLFNFSGDIYGEVIDVEFCHKLREEKKFSSVDELKLNIENDIEQAKQFFNI